MLPSHTWFRISLVEPGTVVSFSSPTPSKWKVIQQLNELEYPKEQNTAKNASSPSYAAAKLLCRNTRHPRQEAYMRIYMQIPYTGTESETLDDRAQQFTSYVPQELKALQAMTQKGFTITPRLLAYSEGRQDQAGWVPGGFIAYLVWEMVPRVRLGDGVGAGVFWELPREQRDQVSEAVEVGFGEMMELGYYLMFAGPKNLVWDNKTKTLYWIGFRDCKLTNPNTKWNFQRLPYYCLVKLPKWEK